MVTHRLDQAECQFRDGRFPRCSSTVRREEDVFRVAVRVCERHGLRRRCCGMRFMHQRLFGFLWELSSGTARLITCLAIARIATRWTQQTGRCSS